jgi:hypothetical protein
MGTSLGAGRLGAGHGRWRWALGTLGAWALGTGRWALERWALEPLDAWALDTGPLEH